MIKMAVSALAVAALLSPIPSCGFHVAKCKKRVAQQQAVLEKEVTRLLPAGSVTAIDREDECQNSPDSGAWVAVTVADAHHVREALAAMHREGWQFTAPFEELDPSDIQVVATKTFSHGTVDVLVDGPLAPGDSGAPTWDFSIDYPS